MDDGRQLSPGEERIIEYLRTGTLDAEIAVRLGISVGETKEKIERLRQRLGLHDRAELARWRPDGRADAGATDWSREAGARRAAEDTHVADEDAEGLPPLTRNERRYSRRAVLGIAGAGAAAMAAGGTGAVALLLRGGGDGEASAGVDTPVATATPSTGVKTTSQPAGTVTTGSLLDAIREDPTAWRRVRLPAGGVIPFRHGAGFMNATDGELDVVQLAGSQDLYGYGYQVSPRNTLVLGRFAGGTAPSAGLLQRQSGTGYTWDRRKTELEIIDDDHLLVWEMRDTGLSGGSAATGRLVVISPGIEPLAEFSLPASIGLMPAGSAVSKDGSMLGLVTSDGQQAFLVKLDTGGEVIPVPSNAPPNRFLKAESMGDGPGIRFLSMASGTDGTSLLLSVIAYGENLTVTTDVLDAGSGGGNPVPLPSPDGRYRLRPGSLRSRYVDLGDNEDWVYTDLVDAEAGQPLFRVLSGHLYYGLGAHRRWLADSSAFVVQAVDPEAPLDTYGQWRTARRYYLASPNGEIDVLPRTPEWVLDLEGDAGISARSYFAYWGGFEPSPHDPDLFAVGGLAIYNRRSDRWFVPGNFVQPIGDDPWGGTSGEIRFVFPPGGKDAAGPGTVLPPAIAYPPFAQDVRLRVARTGDCLNLRERPRGDAAVLDCLVDGTEVVVVEPEHELGEDQGRDFPQGKPAFWSDDREEPYQVYVHVAAPSGRTGWVAIQYLEWV